MDNLNRGKMLPKICATSLNFHKTAQIKQSPIGENSPNLVTLTAKQVTSMDLINSEKEYLSRGLSSFSR
jgi:hypothetical protein